MDMIGGGEPSLNELIRKVQELGAMFTSSMENCQQNIHSLTGGTLLDAQTVANIITAMVTAMESPFSSQNWELMLGAAGASAALPYEGTTFVAAVKAEAPSLDWHEVFSGLDNPHFQVRTKAGLQLLTLVLISGIAPNPFPVGLIYRPWRVNQRGQLSWLTQIIHHPDVFNVIDYPHHSVNLSCLKVFPDERNISVWKCLDLLEVLFRLARLFGLDTHILSLFRSAGPMLTCPDLLFLGIVQIRTPPQDGLRDYMLKRLISSLLAGHANTVAVLQFALNHAKNKMNDILRNAIVLYYSQNLEDQGRLTRILEIAHELEILDELLSMTQFPFVIDLATLAARIDYLKLDKFIEDKLTEHGERFAQDLCHYLRRRCLLGKHPLSNDTFHSMFSTLQQRAAVWPMITADLNRLIGETEMVFFWRSPCRTLWYCSLEVVHMSLDYGRSLLSRRSFLPNLLLIGCLLFFVIVSGRHNTHVKRANDLNFLQQVMSYFVSAMTIVFVLSLINLLAHNFQKRMFEE